MSHVEYFDVEGYFLGHDFIKGLGIDLEKEMMGDQVLSSTEVKNLKKAILLSDQSSLEGKLAGIQTLIETAEGIVEAYGSAVECENFRQSREEFLYELIEREDLVTKYGLGPFLKKTKEVEKICVPAQGYKKSCGC